MLRDDQVLEHGHAREKTDVLEGPGDPGLLRDAEPVHPLQQELAAHLDVDVNVLNKDIWEAGRFETSSIEDVLDEVEAITDDPDSSNPELLLEKAQTSDALVHAIEDLPERKKLVLSLYYVEELTLKEIGAIVGVSESRISQILSETVALLHTKMR